MSSFGGSPCPICGACDARVLFTAADPLEPSATYEVVKCDACGCVRTLGKAPIYAPQYFSIGWFKRLLPGVGASRMRAAVFAGGHGRTPGRLLDFGAGEGDFVALARTRGWEARGLDPNAPRADFRSVEEVEASDFRPDLITLWHSLEHLDDPVAVIRRLAQLLAPGGALFVAVPNFDSVQARWGGPAWFHLDVPRHRVHYTPATLAALATRAGLSMEDYSGPRAEYDPAGWIQTIANRIFSSPNAFYRMLKGDRTVLGWGTLSAFLLPALIPLAWILSFAGRRNPATCEAIFRS